MNRATLLHAGVIIRLFLCLMTAGLTTQQKSRVRRAYRETLAADDHVLALKQMYATFSDLYGVPTDALRAIISADRKKNPDKYGNLREKTAGETVIPSPGSRQKVKAKRGSAEAMQERAHREPAQKRFPKCPRCSNRVEVGPDGKLKRHRFHGSACSGRDPGETPEALPATGSDSGDRQRKLDERIRGIAERLDAQQKIKPSRQRWRRGKGRPSPKSKLAKEIQAAKEAARVAANTPGTPEFKATIAARNKKLADAAKRDKSSLKDISRSVRAVSGGLPESSRRRH